jgi:NitT/TauT family transport system substrate-binding protein
MKKTAGVITILIILAVTIGAWYFLNSHAGFSENPASLTISLKPDETCVLIYIAEDRGYFIDNGLNVTRQEYESDAAALQGMVMGEADISVSAEYPVVKAAFHRENISVIGNIQKLQHWYVIGRVDRGIQSISDLSGKRIGVARMSIGEFYLGRFLNLNEIGIDEVTLVDISFSQPPVALANGDVDAVIAPQYYIDLIEEQLEGNIVIWPGQSNQAVYMVAASRNDWIASHPELIRKFLDALSQAEDYITYHPAEAQTIVQMRLHYTDEYMASMWANQQFSLSLDHSLLIAMNDEGHWMINNYLTDERTIPNFRDYLHTTGLVEVKPRAVNIR